MFYVKNITTTLKVLTIKFNEQVKHKTESNFGIKHNFFR